MWFCIKMILVLSYDYKSDRKICKWKGLQSVRWDRASVYAAHAGRCPPALVHTHSCMYERQHCLLVQGHTTVQAQQQGKTGARAESELPGFGWERWDYSKLKEPPTLRSRSWDYHHVTCLAWPAFLGSSAKIPYYRDIIHASHSFLLIQNLHFFQLGQMNSQVIWLVSDIYCVVSLGDLHLPPPHQGCGYCMDDCYWQIFSLCSQPIFCRAGWPVTAERFWKCSRKQEHQGGRHIG